MSDPKFRLERVQGAPVSTDEIIADLQNVAERAGARALTMNLYSRSGKFASSTIQRRFGTWNNAVIAAGLEIANELNISDESLFENLMLLWEHFGRQPRRAELARSPSLVSWGAYRRRFGTWSAAARQSRWEWSVKQDERISPGL